MNDLGFELPESWRASLISDLGTRVQSGQTPLRHQKANFGGDIPWVKTLDLNERVIVSTQESLSQQGFKSIGSTLRPPDTVIVAMYGGKGTIGKSGILAVSAATNQALCCIEPNPEVFDPKFLHFFLISFRKEWMKFAIGTRKDPNISKAVVERTLIPLPPLPEQKKIAHILSTVQRAIEEQESIIQTTTELKKALMHKLFTEGLRNEPQKQTEIGPVPGSWEVVKLSAVCSFQSGGTPSKQKPEYWEGSIPWVSPKDMKRPRLTDVTDHISQEALESGSKLAPAGSVFVVVRGMILAKTVPVALAEVPMAINQDMKAIVPGTKLRSDFLLYALETLRGALFKKVGRAGHGTATLMSNEISNFMIPLPDLEVQREISAAIYTLEKKKELHQRKLAELQALFRILLHELMTAQLAVSKVSFQPSTL